MLALPAGQTDERGETVASPTPLSHTRMDQYAAHAGARRPITHPCTGWRRWRSNSQRCKSTGFGPSSRWCWSPPHRPCTTKQCRR